MDQSPKPPIEKQVSSGGVAYRQSDDGIEIALIFVRFRGKERWQLPKGIVDPGESPEQAALREIGEEAGIATELIQPLDVIEYWYVGKRKGSSVRFHKFVHFFLCKYLSGDVRNHDAREVVEARWISIGDAITMLAFGNEKKVVRQAQEILAEKK